MLQLFRLQLNGGKCYGSDECMGSRCYQIWSWSVKTRKLMTMNGNLHPRGNVGRLYLQEKKEEEG